MQLHQDSKVQAFQVQFNYNAQRQLGGHRKICSPDLPLTIIRIQYFTSTNKFLEQCFSLYHEPRCQTQHTLNEMQPFHRPYYCETTDRSRYRLSQLKADTAQTDSKYSIQNIKTRRKNNSLTYVTTRAASQKFPLTLFCSLNPNC